MEHEEKVRAYYDSATVCYESIMGDTWHHGAPDIEAAGGSVMEACRALEERVVKEAEIKVGDLVLDFGSGVGGPTLYMAKISSARFVGIANNEVCNQKARARGAATGVAQYASFLTVGDTDYKSMPFPSNSFDAVIFYESVCHLPDKAAFFGEVARLLKPGRRMVGIDWLQRPFGEHRTEEQILRYMQPVNETICIPWHGTVQGYRALMEAAGLTVQVARDLFEGNKCWGSTPTGQRPEWLGYSGPDFERFRRGKEVLDEAREAGVFTVGMFVATKPR